MQAIDYSCRTARESKTPLLSLFMLLGLIIYACITGLGSIPIRAHKGEVLHVVASALHNSKTVSAGT